MARLDLKLLLSYLLLAATLAGLALLSWFKGINFDEALALRSGWLALAHADASPLLWSPWTLLLGALAHLSESPGLVLHLARALTLAWLLSGVWANLRGRSAACAALALLLAACCDPVIAHLPDFRYDASLIGAVLWYQAQLRRQAPLTWRSGLLLGFLMMHQLKGLALGVVLFSLTALVRPRRRQLVCLLIGASGVLLAWAALSWASGHGASWREGYVLFFELARTPASAAPEARVQLAPTLCITLLAIGLGAWSKRDAPWLAQLQSQLSDHASWLAFAALLLVHPRIFPYHLAPVALLASLVVATRVERLAPRAIVGLAWCAPLASAVGWWLGFGGSVASVERVVAMPLETTIRTLGALRAAAHAGDRVFDPSGVLYFLPSCGREWYVDVLFAGWAQQGRWMYSPVSPPCTWSLRTHRLALVPKQHLAAIGAFRLHPGTGGLLSAEGAERRVEPLGLGDRTPSTW